MNGKNINFNNKKIKKSDFDKNKKKKPRLETLMLLKY